MKAKFIFEQFDNPETKEKFKNIFSKSDLADLAKLKPHQNKFSYGGYHGKDSADLNKVINQRATSWGAKELDTQAIAEVAYRLLTKDMPFLKDWKLKEGSAENPAHYLNVQKEVPIPDPEDKLDRPWQAEVNIWVVYFAKPDEIMEEDEGKLKVLVSMQIRSQEKGGLLWDIGKNSKKWGNKKTEFKPTKKKGGCAEGECEIDFNDAENEKQMDDLMDKLQDMMYGQPDKQDEKISKDLKIYERNITLEEFNDLLPKIEKNLKNFNNFLKYKYEISIL